MTETPSLREDPASPGRWLAGGDWTLSHANRIEGFAQSTGAAQGIDACGIRQLDASGAMLLWRLLRGRGLDATALALRD